MHIPLVSMSVEHRTQLQAYIDTYGETAVIRAFFTTPATLTKIRLGGMVRQATLNPFIERLANASDLESNLQAGRVLPVEISNEKVKELAAIAEKEGKGRLAQALGISPITLNRLLEGKCDPATLKYVISAAPGIMLEPRKKVGRPKKKSFNPYD